jgi:hypothetical protein
MMPRSKEKWTITFDDVGTTIAWRFEEFEDGKVVDIREESVSKNGGLMLTRLAKILHEALLAGTDITSATDIVDKHKRVITIEKEI